jgi:ABC-type microcin C transport system duplicated ATPase subunit YejF
VAAANRPWGTLSFDWWNHLEGEILFQGHDVVKMDQKELRQFRQQAQIIFQDQFGCMNPRMTVGQIIAEPLLMRQGVQVSKEELGREVAELLRCG